MVTTTPPPNETRIPPERDLDGIPLEEPPPYTSSPAVNSGETTIELGPGRPFQQPPALETSPRTQAPNNFLQTGNSSPPPASSSSTSLQPFGGRSGSLLRQLTSSLNNAVQNLNNPNVVSHPTGQNSWSSYPGQQRGSPLSQPNQPPPPPPRPPPVTTSTGSRLEPPPRHPRSASASAPGSTYRSNSPPALPGNMRRHSSEFARDFYAVGDAHVPQEDDPSLRAPPPPPRPTATGSSTRPPVPNDGRPTTNPTTGHPLLKNGKLLVYPKGYECDKCHNVGYKNADPQRPCKRCWNKYAKSFSGPLVYSFNNPSDSSSAQPESNFQRPLPQVSPPVPPAPPPPPPPLPPIPPPRNPTFFQPRSSFPTYSPQGRWPDNQGGLFSPPGRLFSPPGSFFPSTGIRSNSFSRPPPGAIVYTSGDPRLGGRLCWNCNGKGNTSFLIFDRETCTVCNGLGRTFP